MNETPFRTSLNSFKESDSYRNGSKPFDYGSRNHAGPIRAIDIFQDGPSAKSQLSNRATQDRALKYIDIRTTNLDNMQKNSFTPNEYGFGSNRQINLESSTQAKQELVKVNYRKSNYVISQTRKLNYATNIPLDLSNNHDSNNNPDDKQRPSEKNPNNWIQEENAIQLNSTKHNTSTKLNTFSETNPQKSYAERTLFDNTTRRSESDDFLSVNFIH